ncbi:MAG: hypothetical protein AVDCRST_MAG49-4582, partial [uncultured Thermomicrobiales bacterium]
CRRAARLSADRTRSGSGQSAGGPGPSRRIARPVLIRVRFSGG